MISLHSWSILLVLVGSLAAVSAAGGLQPALVAAGLEAPGATHTALRDLGLSTIHEIQLLDSVEAREMAESLQRAGIMLGDRSKLRRAVGGQSGVPPLQMQLQADALKAPVRDDTVITAADVYSTDGAWVKPAAKAYRFHEPARQLQEQTASEKKDGLSGDSIVFILTGVVRSVVVVALWLLWLCRCCVYRGPPHTRPQGAC
jgi:hypothetical protein